MLILLIVSLVIGIISTNFLYRDVSWSEMIMTDYWSYSGARGTGLEKYLYVLVFITLLVFVILGYCVTYFTEGVQ